MKYITRATKTKSIIASVITALALITLIMLSTLLNISSAGRMVMCLIYTLVLMLVVCIWQGIVQIEVFNDYRSKKKLLCADGILSICMGILLAVSGTLFGVLQASSIIGGETLARTDIRVFLTGFLLVMAIWKLVNLIISIKEKRFDWWVVMIGMILWFVLSILCFVSIFLKSLTVISWIIIVFGWLNIAENIFNSLYSYVIKEPTYLANNIKEDEDDGKNVRDIYMKEKEIKYKLSRLKELKEAKLISEDDYDEEKQKLLSEFRGI